MTGSEYTLEELSESDDHLRWVLEQHSKSLNNAGGFCAACGGRMPCDITSLAASGLHRSALLAERDAEIARLVVEVGPLRTVADALQAYQEAVERVKCGSPARDLRAPWAEVKAAADALRAALAARGAGASVPSSQA